jgi:aspartate/methionine/tyrosine aminotransferase
VGRGLRVLVAIPHCPRVLVYRAGRAHGSAQPFLWQVARRWHAANLRTGADGLALLLLTAAGARGSGYRFLGCDLPQAVSARIPSATRSTQRVSERRPNLMDLELMTKLTRDESVGLSLPYNLADAHTRYTPSEIEKSEIIDRLSSIYYEAVDTSQDIIDRRAFEAFLALGGQSAAAQRHAFLPTYSASISMEIAAIVLSKRAKAAALTHPTFDNIADILKRHQISIAPLGETLTDQPLREAITQLNQVGVGAIVLVSPNNPTGRVIQSEELYDIGILCAKASMTLVLDCCFRLYDDRAVYDHYEVLAQTGVEYVIIEDTGKIWPTQDIKLSYLVPSSTMLPDLLDAYDDVILNVSPFISNLVYYFSMLSDDRHQHSFMSITNENRLHLRASLPENVVSFPYRDSRISVDILEMGTSERASTALELLRAEGVNVLSARAFHWSSPSQGASRLRVALARDPAYFATAVQIMANVFDGLK